MCNKSSLLYLSSIGTGPMLAHGGRGRNPSGGIRRLPRFEGFAPLRQASCLPPRGPCPSAQLAPRYPAGRTPPPGSFAPPGRCRAPGPFPGRRPRSRKRRKRWHRCHRFPPPFPPGAPSSRREAHCPHDPGVSALGVKAPRPAGAGRRTGSHFPKRRFPKRRPAPSVRADC